jgi:hypothetical protein
MVPPKISIPDIAPLRRFQPKDGCLESDLAVGDDERVHRVNDRALRRGHTPLQEQRIPCEDRRTEGELSLWQRTESGGEELPDRPLPLARAAACAAKTSCGVRVMGCALRGRYGDPRCPARCGTTGACATP